MEKQNKKQGNPEDTSSQDNQAYRHDGPEREELIKRLHDIIGCKVPIDALGTVMQGRRNISLEGLHNCFEHNDPDFIGKYGNNTMEEYVTAVFGEEAAHIIFKLIEDPDEKAKANIDPKEALKKILGFITAQAIIKGLDPDHIPMPDRRGDGHLPGIGKMHRDQLNDDPDSNL